MLPRDTCKKTGTQFRCHSKSRKSLNMGKRRGFVNNNKEDTFKRKLPDPGHWPRLCGEPGGMSRR